MKASSSALPDAQPLPLSISTSTDAAFRCIFKCMMRPRMSGRRSHSRPAAVAFQDAAEDGRATSVPATFTFEWGQRELPASSEALMAYVGRQPAQVPSELHPPVISAPPPEYPLEAQLAGAEGTVVLSLIVDESGSARDLHVAESVGHGLDEGGRFKVEVPAHRFERPCRACARHDSGRFLSAARGRTASSGQMTFSQRMAASLET